MGSNSSAAHSAYTIGPTIHVAINQGQNDDHQPGDLPQADGTDPVPTSKPPDQSSAGTGPQLEPKGVSRASPEALTPIPETPPEGLGVGVPVLVGGADLADSTATLISYASPSGPREVLLATVEQNAEPKLMEALAVSATVMVPVQVTEQVTGRLPLDKDKQLYEQLEKAVISVNHKIKSGKEIPEHTKDYVTTALDAVTAVSGNANVSDAEVAMAAYYGDRLELIQSHIADTALGKVPFIAPYETTGEVTITKHVPAPLGDEAQGLPTTLRDAQRIRAKVDPTTGVASWDGTSRTTATGSEYLVGLGDGYTAIYRPYAANEKSGAEYSLRGQLEIHAPAGAGHGKHLVRNLGNLHLVNRPMSAAEGEWTYLNNNITAQGLATAPSVSKAVAQAKHLEELELQEIFHTQAHLAVGLDEPALQSLARDFQLEAAARCLPKKVKLLRAAVATATGFPDGEALAASPSYDPAPKVSGGWLTWGRFDVAGSSAKLTHAWSGKRLIHHVSGGNLASMLTAGVLTSTERRAVMGVKPGKGMSESSDKRTGGANSVFLRATSAPNPTGPALVWDDPTTLLSRSDYYAYGSDHFGCLNPKSGHSTSGQTRDPYKIAQFKGSSNEIMFKHGIDLLGTEAPSRIVCSSPAQRQQLLDIFAAKEITHLAGKPVTEIVT
ncbi:hypothetical protein J4573_16355 [Actinomadura barringtoniae]|uniref:Uncharacterized protein n=1 Tax=Actinomadura barringtoniae TaxID=1427535 RepID=A0A939TA47_9ACTN|nr:hypothetical protein [Actinomadura barringtoniae]MBO2448675.1 hypothetical protein [Actinomadura barringtoniae]